MRYYIDTEFIDDGRTIDLISIGVVAEDGRELYLQSTDFYAQKASTWIADNVYPHLFLCGDSLGDDLLTHCYAGQCYTEHSVNANCAWRTRNRIRAEIAAFMEMDKKPEFYGWCCAYDWVAICQLFGTMMDLPKNWPHYMRDIQMLLDTQSIDDSDLPPQTEIAHNALADARYIKQIFEEVL